MNLVARPRLQAAVPFEKFTCERGSVAECGGFIQRGQLLQCDPPLAARQHSCPAGSQLGRV